MAAQVVLLQFLVWYILDYVLHKFVKVIPKQSIHLIFWILLSEMI